MTHETKVTVSAGELAMAMDPNFILTKRTVMDRASALFSYMIPCINLIFEKTLSSDKKLSAAVPKISRGENYMGFPYIIMDHPATFSKDNIFALRTMFLWGHWFSIQLHLSGEYKTVFQEIISKNSGNNEEFFIATGESEWDHHFEESNYVPCVSLSNAERGRAYNKTFLKLALKYELQNWNNMQTILQGGYKKINSLLCY